MANSAITMTLKNKVVNALCENPDIDYLIDSSKYHGKALKGTHIFNYDKNPDVVTETTSFITVTVDLHARDRNKTYVTPILCIRIYSHNDCMDIKEEFLNNGEFVNRNDYLGNLIDEQLSNHSEYGGLSDLKLVSNTEHVINRNFNCRKLIFETIDVNSSLCDRG